MCGRLSEVFENQAENKGEKSNITVKVNSIVLSNPWPLNLFIGSKDVQFRGFDYTVEPL